MNKMLMTELLDYMRNERDSLRRELAPYRTTIVALKADGACPEGQMFGMNQLFKPDILIGQRLKIGVDYYDVVQTNRNNFEITLRMVEVKT